MKIISSSALILFTACCVTHLYVQNPIHLFFGSFGHSFYFCCPCKFSLVRWMSGWNQRFAKPSYDLKVVPRVRIPPSPQIKFWCRFMYCVYILYSATIERYYCGQTNNLQVRLDNHNSGSTISNKYGIPWILIGFINCETRSEPNWFPFLFNCCDFFV